MASILRGTGSHDYAEAAGEAPATVLPSPAERQPLPTPGKRTKVPLDFQLGDKRKRGGKLFAAIAALFLIGALGTAAWFFQEPIKAIVARYMSPKKASAEQPGEAPEGETTKQAITTQTTESTPAPEEKNPSVFNPLAKNPDAKPEDKPDEIVPPKSGGPDSSGMTKPPVVSNTIVPPGFSPSNPPSSPQQPEIEIKSVKLSDNLLSMPAVPKATVVEEGTDKGTGQKSEHVPGTALGQAPKPTIVVDSPAKSTEPAPPTLAPSPAQAATTTAEAVNSVIDMKPEAAPAIEALHHFFAAKSLDERLKHTLGSAAVKPLMERYYAKTDPGPLAVNEIRFLRYDPTPETGGGAHCVFSVASKLWEYPIPVMLQKEGGSFKVDWLAFVEFRDNLLFQFLSSFQDMPARFHVGIRRTHYFDEDVPDLDSKDCFEIQPPFPSYVGYVFVPKGTPLATDLGNRISWDTVASYVIVELRWKRLGEMKWVELSAVPQLNWYSFQTTAQQESSTKEEKKTSGGMDAKKPKKAK